MGHIRGLQKKQFADRLCKLPGIEKIAEIGFNAGHSAECFFENCKNLTGLVSFDINCYPYTKPCAEYCEQLHQNRFLFIEGDSLVRVPEFARCFPDQKFDLIFIDGCHVFEMVVADILHSKLLAHQKTVLWLDDYHQRGVRQAVQFCKITGAIRITKVFAHEVVGLEQRKWVEAAYTFA